MVLLPFVFAPQTYKWSCKFDPIGATSRVEASHWSSPQATGHGLVLASATSGDDLFGSGSLFHRSLNEAGSCKLVIVQTQQSSVKCKAINTDRYIRIHLNTWDSNPIEHTWIYVIYTMPWPKLHIWKVRTQIPWGKLSASTARCSRCRRLVSDGLGWWSESHHFSLVWGNNNFSRQIFPQTNPANFWLTEKIKVPE